ncbi:MAG: sodium:calcium antiporter [Chloroflexi bacterium]|nr:sodium:calcium antiporter [Chloroflexota bacterium]
MVLLDILYIALGLAGLYFGGDWLVEGASRLARVLGVPVAIIGLTIVAFGTSVPELVTNLVAAVRDTNDIAVGNIVGSNIANIALILGLSAIMASRALSTREVQQDWVIMLAVAVLGYVLLLIDGDLSRVDGAILFTGIVLYVIRAVRGSREKPADASEEQEASTSPERSSVLKRNGPNRHWSWAVDYRRAAYGRRRSEHRACTRRQRVGDRRDAGRCRDIAAGTGDFGHRCDQRAARNCFG